MLSIESGFTLVYLSTHVSIWYIVINRIPTDEDNKNNAVVWILAFVYEKTQEDMSWVVIFEHQFLVGEGATRGSGSWPLEQLSWAG